MSEMAGEVVGRKLALGIEALIARDTPPTGEQGPVACRRSGVAFLLAIAASRISMLPVSSTGIWFSSVVSPPP